AYNFASQYPQKGSTGLIPSNDDLPQQFMDDRGDHFRGSGVAIDQCLNPGYILQMIGILHRDECRGDIAKEPGTVEAQRRCPVDTHYRLVAGSLEARVIQDEVILPLEDLDRLEDHGPAFAHAFVVVELLDHKAFRLQKLAERLIAGRRVLPKVAAIVS